MIKMEIVKYPNPILNKKCSKVTEFDQDLHLELFNMIDVMNRSKGIGLAANQVGLDKAMFVMISQEHGTLIEAINPELIHLTEDKANLSEGCLSASGEFDIVQERVNIVSMKYQDKNGEQKEITLTGIDAVCAQHEYDHLQGIFFFSKLDLTRQRRRALERKWGKI